MTELLSEFKLAADSGQYTNLELAAKFGITERTVYKWKAKLREQHKLPPRETAEKIDWDEDGNYAEAQSISDRITTVDQLLEAAKVDLDVWEKVDAGVQKWEVGAKDKQGRLVWEDGKIIDGVLHYNGIKVQDLWSVWVKLRKKVLEPVTATIQPVECPVTYKVEHIMWGPVQTSLVWTDPQFGYRWDGDSLVPFHDREVLDLWLQIASWLQPARIDILGDWFDATGWSDKFIKHPNTDKTTQPSILESHWWLRQFREACPNTRISIHPGNHDARITNSIIRHLPVAYGLRAADEMELPPALHPARLLSLHNLDIQWLTDYPNDEDWLGDSLRLNHGVWYSSRPGGTVAKSVQESDVNTVSGHNHRSEHASRTRHLKTGPETLTSYSIGCTCHIDGRVPAKHKYLDWQQSAGLFQYTNTHHGFTAIPVSNHGPKKAIVDSKLFTARDRIADLTHDLPEYPWRENGT